MNMHNVKVDQRPTRIRKKFQAFKFFVLLSICFDIKVPFGIKFFWSSINQFELTVCDVIALSEINYDVV